MNFSSFKRGSALLMVLGMIAFMIVSALGFAAYMRYSRLPSSYLRRNTQARQLVKAGLARAIDDIDLAINSNPHPGVGFNNSGSESISGCPGNYWRGRVFMGYSTNMTVSTEKGGGRWGQTVPVLTLEGLAYIPPPLVNEARVYSRITSSAEWHNLDYDAGRYAFVAIDVSDYFDVNRMVCDKPRSSAPERRVSFSYIFEKGEKHESFDSDGANQFGQFLDRFRERESEDSVAFDYSKKTPLVSVADFNLAIWRAGRSAGVGGIRSPFCEYLQGNKDYAGFYGFSGGVSTGGTAHDFLNQEELMRRQTFVTDGFYPDPTYRKIKDDPYAIINLNTLNTTEVKAGAEYPKRPLSDDKNQPFRRLADKERDKFTFDDILRGNTEGGGSQEYMNKLSVLGMVCLADYLDFDTYPLSLALPCWEKRPMIVGIQPQSLLPQIKLKLLELTDKEKEKSDFRKSNGDADEVVGSVITSQDGTLTRVVRRTDSVVMDVTQMLKMFIVKTEIAYPFTTPEDNPPNYYVDCNAKFFFATESQGPMRTTYGDEANAGSNYPLPLVKKDAPFETYRKCKGNYPNRKLPSVEFDKGMISYWLGADDSTCVKFQDSISDEVSAVKPVMFGVEDGFSSTDEFVEKVSSTPIIKIEHQWTQAMNPKTKTWTPDFKEALQSPEKYATTVSGVKLALKPLVPSEGYVVDNEKFDGLYKGDSGSDNFKDYRDGKLSVDLTLNLAVAARIVEDKGPDFRVVDMVPASTEYDLSQNKDHDQYESEVATETVKMLSGSDYPLMRFDTGVTLKLGYKDIRSLFENYQKKGNAIDSEFKVSPKTVVCLDPRFNYAPESWLAVDRDLADKEGSSGWLEEVKSFRAKNQYLERDIFLTTSDQGWLQSPYELAYLPRFSNLYTCDDEVSEIFGGKLKSPTETSEFPKTLGAVLNSELMWNCYDPFKRDKDAFADLGITARGPGMKVNPYSDNMNILMAAFANTPDSWRSAGMVDEEDTEFSVKSFNSTYAMNAIDPKDDHFYMAWSSLTNIASKLREEVRKPEHAGDWESAFDALKWIEETSSQDNDQSANSFCGVEMECDRLWGVDRKFLYGFWRDCFSADQQLFLIFVRAEPSMMGGEITGQVPPNLGARAVALVWRDPRECLENPVGDYGIKGYPHKTRVLFYHSLD